MSWIMAKRGAFWSHASLYVRPPFGVEPTQSSDACIEQNIGFIEYRGFYWEWRVTWCDSIYSCMMSLDIIR